MPRLSLLLLPLLSALSLSEGRALSRCELRDQLFPLVKLPSRSQRNRLRIMARVICEVERFSSLNTDIVREYKKEIFDLDDPTTTTITTTAPTTAAPRPTTTATSTTTTTTTSATTAPEQQGTNTTANPPPTTVITSTTTTTITAPITSPPVNTTSRTSAVAVARRRRAVSVITAKFFGIFQFSNRKYCNSGHVYSSEDKCKSHCDAFVDEDISNDLECFVQSGLFWAVFRDASSACKSRRTQNAFFRACDAGETAPPPNRVVARVFMSGGNYK